MNDSNHLSHLDCLNDAFICEPDDIKMYGGFEVVDQAKEYKLVIHHKRMIILESDKLTDIVCKVLQYDPNFQLEQVMKKHNYIHSGKHEITKQNLTPILLISLLIEHYCYLCGNENVDTWCCTCLFRYHYQCLKQYQQPNLEQISSTQYTIKQCVCCLIDCNSIS